MKRERDLHAQLAPWTGDIAALFAWICEGAPPVDVKGAWLLAHCDEGVVWGRRDGDRWALSGSAFPRVSPALTRHGVQQLRVFGEEGELLVWRHDGELRARWLAEQGGDVPAAMRPADEERLLLGESRESVGCFTLLEDATGARQAVPFAQVKKGRHPTLRVRHYFERDGESGAVRVAASRLVAVTEG